MAAKYMNISSVPMSLAVFLATDNYDHNPDPNTISATSLIKPLRQLILSSRADITGGLVDLGAMMANRLGAAVHDCIERSWLHNYRNALTDLGYPSKVIDRVLINPKPEDLFAGCIPIYMEQRASKSIGGYTVAGKFDFIGDGYLEDFKSTGVYTYLVGDNSKAYILQGSIYRWLNPTIINRDTLKINYIFTDWSSMGARQNPNYPQQRFKQVTFNFMSIPETEAYIIQRLKDIDRLWDADQELLPLCTDEELWRSEPVYKYYGSGVVGPRSTKNFSSELEANSFRISKGKGIVVEKPGEVTKCKYCAGFSICTQKDDLIKSGDLIL